MSDDSDMPVIHADADNLVMAQNIEGNFMLAESVDEVLRYAKSHPGIFPEEICVAIGRYAKDEEGKTCWDFDNFRFYMPDGVLKELSS